MTEARHAAEHETPRGRIVQINRSNGGVPKRAVQEARLEEQGLAGDGVNHPKIHGGPESAGAPA